MNTRTIRIKQLGMQKYQPIWQAMQQFTVARNEHSIDEIWLLQHEAVFTQGQNGKEEHLLIQNHIPVIKTDRGGQITYHGPGQLMVYTLIDLLRLKINIRQFVTALEESVIDYLATEGIPATRKASAPGVYVRINNADAKICSIGLRVKRGSTFHGIAFNIDMDLTPFKQINPCGFKSLPITQVSQFKPNVNFWETAKKLSQVIVKHLNYDKVLFQK